MGRGRREDCGRVSRFGHVLGSLRAHRSSCSLDAAVSRLLLLPAATASLVVSCSDRINNRVALRLQRDSVRAERALEQADDPSVRADLDAVGGGTFGRPGIVMMSPQMTRRTRRPPRAAARAPGSHDRGRALGVGVGRKLYCVLAMHTDRWPKPVLQLREHVFTADRARCRTRHRARGQWCAPSGPPAADHRRRAA